MRGKKCAKYFLEYRRRNNQTYPNDSCKKYSRNRTSQWIFNYDDINLTSRSHYYKYWIFPSCFRGTPPQSHDFFQTTKLRNHKRNTSEFLKKSHLRYFSGNNWEFFPLFWRCTGSTPPFPNRKHKCSVRETQKYPQYSPNNLWSYLYRWGLSYDTRILW